MERMLSYLGQKLKDSIKISNGANSKTFPIAKAVSITITASGAHKKKYSSGANQIMK